MAQDDAETGRPKPESPDRDAQNPPAAQRQDDVPPQDKGPQNPPAEAPADEVSAEALLVGYDPLKHYDPQIEFGMLDKLRNEVDANLGKVTTRFITGIIGAYKLTALVMAWTAVVLPIAAWIGWPLLAMHSWAQIGIILGAPALLYIGLLAWRYTHVRVRLKWARVDLERYVADRIALRLKEDNGRWTGAIDGLGPNSEMALLELLRIRPRAFHTWHRISVHPIMMSIKLRGPLETKMFSPRFYAMVLPLGAILFFLAYHIGVTSASEEVQNAQGVWPSVVAWTSTFWAGVSQPRLNLGWGVVVPLFAVFLLAFILAYRCFLSTVAIHGYVMGKVGKTLQKANNLTPFSHDCSKAILHKHHLLLRLFTRMMWWGRTHGGGGSVRDLLDDLKADFGEMGVDFELARTGEAETARGTRNPYAERGSAEPFSARRRGVHLPPFKDPFSDD